MSGSPLMQRFQVKDAAQFHPGQCAACGSPRGPLLDTGIDIPQAAGVYRLYLCFADLTAMYNVVQENTGADATKEATRSISSILEQHNLVGVPRELFDNFVGASILLSASVESLPDLDLEFAESDEADGEDSDSGDADNDADEPDAGERDEPEFALLI